MVRFGRILTLFVSFLLISVPCAPQQKTPLVKPAAQNTPPGDIWNDPVPPGEQMLRIARANYDRFLMGLPPESQRLWRRHFEELEKAGAAAETRAAAP